MTRPHLIAKLIFVAMGVYLLMRSLSKIGSIVITLSSNCPPENFATKILIITIELIITLTLSLILLFWPNGLVGMIAGPDASHCEKVNGRWIIAAFRMTACLCGLFILYRRIELLFFYIPAIIKGPNILSYMTLEGQSSAIPIKQTVGFLVEIAKLIFAIYLIFGAPHYVRWQMRTIKVKELNQSGGVEEYEQK
jgi:hypothetical protein